ncbi:MAG: DUF4383 domain-containing protein [Actinobacteria bacterium]|nr:DUF4383 domain-containing protein [Actinomycetota bacterium]
MNDRSPAQVYAFVIGGTLVVAGVVGFFYSASFDSPGTVHDVFGVLGVNGWHNVVHVATGALGLVSLTYAAARTYSLVLGVVYVAIAIWGFVIGSGESILGFIPVNTEDSVLHAIIGVSGLAAYAATPAAPAPTSGPPRTTETRPPKATEAGPPPT